MRSSNPTTAPFSHATTATMDDDDDDDDDERAIAMSFTPPSSPGTVNVVERVNMLDEE
jgi:hypothetical protein